MSQGIPPIIDLGAVLSAPPPAAANEPAAILAAWTALEALSPQQTYRRPEELSAKDCRVAALSPDQLPWMLGERPPSTKRRYYQVVLGAIRMDAATEALVACFGEPEDALPPMREKAAIGAVLLNEHGAVVEENGICVSSFAWALPLALRRELGALGAWTKIEPRILDTLDGILRRTDEDGRGVPLDLPAIERAHRWLVAQFGLPARLVEPPTFALCVNQDREAKNAPEPLLLNSFFLRDLARGAALVQQGDAPAGLRRYLGIERFPTTFNLLEDQATREAAVAPAKTPAARWPAPGGHPLVTLQQAAVNLTREELATRDGIIAVNGPPGTGKTTLLRDVVASCVLDRALAMAAFDEPGKAFEPSGDRVTAGPKAFFDPCRLAPALKGHEVLVASSNNKAVENVSRELPSVKAIGRAGELTYFKSVSDVVQRAAVGDQEGGDAAGDALGATETWGLIAAVLGNAKNRHAFSQSFWWHEEVGFRLYLKAAKGDGVTHPDCPPSPRDADARWRAARDRLLSLKREVDAELAALEKIRQLCLQFDAAARALAEGDARLAALRSQRDPLEAAVSQREADLTAARRDHTVHAGRVQRHRTVRPGCFDRLLGTERARSWSRANAPLLEAEAAAARRLREAERARAIVSSELDRLADAIRQADARLAAARQQVAALSQRVDAHRPAHGDRLVDARFFERGHEAWNLAAPWIPDSLHRKREDLFIAAMAVHRAFIDASAQKVLHNLGTLMMVLSGSTRDEGARRLLADLWSTLFLVVPVVSTTFASVDRMLGELPAGSIGWLLIDEAGQALPQAAVGAILRARRSIVVGDPLQIQPVVTFPERLTAEVCRFFHVETPLWAAPQASAQTVADRASRFQAAFQTDRGPRLVGIPLLVHRRCHEPMFGISNQIAYDGQMVHAPGPDDAGMVGTLLGPSAWLDLDGEADSKWCPAEGDLVVSLLARIADAGLTAPDLFIITPFRIVAWELRQRLTRETRLLSRLGINARLWPDHRVGTIHTVQGREADTVILVLGAPNASQHGARAWAAGTPNVFNVAVSRARHRLYVVGSYEAWARTGHARTLASSLERRR